MEFDISSPPRAQAHVYGYDRIAIAIDRPRLDRAVKRLQSSCGDRLKVTPGRMSFNPNWQGKVELFQPSEADLEILVGQCLGHEVGAMPTYAEIAADFIFDSAQDARRYARWLLARVVFRHQRESVHIEGSSTVYFARRTDKAGSKRGRVGCMYSDRPSKLAGEFQGRPCVHIEIRLTGSAALSDAGIASASDLQQFDHAQFWRSALSLRELPTKTELGRLIGGNGGASVSGSALRKRADKFIGECSCDGQFCMHNAARSKRDIVRRLVRIPLSDVMPTARGQQADDD